MDSKTWVFSHAADGEYPVTFCGSEEKMDVAAKSLMGEVPREGVQAPSHRLDRLFLDEEERPLLPVR